jgi:Flp pilus assembly protein TadG
MGIYRGKKIIALLRFFNRDDGTVLIFTVLLLTVILGFAAFAVDGGILYLAKNQLQAAVDASALAGGSALVVNPSDVTGASSRAVQYASLNKCVGQPVNGANVSVSFPRITVDASSTVNLFFARLLGINTATITATATAELGQVNSTEGMRPFVIPNLPYTFGQRVVLKEGTKYEPSFYGIAQPPGYGSAGDIKNVIANGINVLLKVGDPLEQVPGNKVGNVKQGIDAIIAQDPKAVWVPGTGGNQGYIDHSNFPGFSSPRIITIAFTDNMLTDPIIIANFGAFFLEGSNGKDIMGNFIRTTTPGEWSGLVINTGKAAPGTLRVKLVK